MQFSLIKWVDVDGVGRVYQTSGNCQSNFFPLWKFHFCRHYDCHTNKVFLAPKTRLSPIKTKKAKQRMNHGQSIFISIQFHTTTYISIYQPHTLIQPHISPIYRSLILSPRKSFSTQFYYSYHIVF